MNQIARGALAPSSRGTLVPSLRAVCTPGVRRGTRALAAMSVMAALAACGSQPETGPVSGVRASSSSSSRTASYDPPGPSSDPWGPYIREASARFDVPDRWIREVMRQESGGRITATSRVGAMGLLQLMPGTYAEMNAKYGLGDDPYHPWANLMAGTAYIREMYDLYGSPGFLAAYNGGPRRLENYLWSGGRMPDETRNYVARIGPRLSGEPRRRAPEEVYAAADIGLNPPSRRSSGADPATMLAIREQRRNAAPSVQMARQSPASAPAQSQLASLGPNVYGMDPIPDGSTYSGGSTAMASTQLASLGPNVIRMEPIPDGSTYSQDPAPVVVARMDPIPDGSTYARDPAPVVVARMDPIPDPPSAAPRGMAVASAEARSVAAPTAMPFERATGRGFSFVSPAQAGTLPAPMARQNGLPPGVMRAGIAAPVGGWAIQVGAFASENLARDAAGQARSGAGNGSAVVMAVAQGRSTLYRARVTGLSRDAAQTACDRIRGRGTCMLISPDSQG
jgi:hypothetical protein